MALDSQFISLLVCPESSQPLQLATTELTAALNQKIEQRALQNKKGETLSLPIEGALLREDQQVFYPIREEIPDLLIEEGISLPADLSALV